MVNPPGWYPDPTGSFDVRYWDGAAWTAHVVANEVQTESPIPDTDLDQPVAATSPRTSRRRRKIILLVSAATAAVVALVGLLVLIVEYNSEKDDLAEYRASVKKESARRVSLLEKYEARDQALQKVVAAQAKIDSLVAKMKKSDCYRTDPCYGADAWNKNSKKLDTLFDQQEAWKNENAAAIGDIRQVAPPDDLWMLSLLGKDDSAEVKAELERPMPAIRDAREAINKSIDVIDRWNNDCKPDKIVSCDGDPVILGSEA
ncbi:hypothetical protein GCM10022234_25580 [Aeromicrobium panaciterrae]|uniref:DUF2510 domain-containing protein n=1 Tax=Aeromicrobium panaciterrae TaxID=363861 RepID=UPI0031D93C9E